MVPAGRIAGVVVVVAVSVFVLAAAPVTSAQTQSVAATPTFTKDVLPILQRSCQTCHRPGTHAPMSLMTYKDARPWVR